MLLQNSKNKTATVGEPRRLARGSRLGGFWILRVFSSFKVSFFKGRTSLWGSCSRTHTLCFVAPFFSLFFSSSPPSLYFGQEIRTEAFSLVCSAVNHAFSIRVSALPHRRNRRRLKETWGEKRLLSAVFVKVRVTNVGSRRI